MFHFECSRVIKKQLFLVILEKVIIFIYFLSAYALEQFFLSQFFPKKYRLQL